MKTQMLIADLVFAVIVIGSISAFALFYELISVLLGGMK